VKHLSSRRRESVQIETRAFGPLEIDDAQVVTLTEPMPGFSAYTRFAVLEPEPDSPFKWFQSLDRDELCFLITDPRPFFPDYKLEVSASHLTDLAISDATETAVAVVLNVPADLDQATANLLAPLVFNTDKKLARQVILEGSGYPIRAPLFPEETRACQNE
jgi:flagellar assembly factor FliW